MGLTDRANSQTSGSYLSRSSTQVQVKGYSLNQNGTKLNQVYGVEGVVTVWQICK